MEALTVKNGFIDNIALFEDDADLPEGWQKAPPRVGIGWSDNGDGTFTAPPADPIPEPTAKEIRDNALAALIYDFEDGRVMQTRSKDESNVRNAIDVMKAESIQSIDWVMVDNKKYPVTAEELKIALAAGQLAAMQIWNNYDPGENA